MIHLRRAFALLILPFAITMYLAESANAGTYTVHGCRLPSGAVAPANGWVPSGIGMWVTTENSCASGGALYAALNAHTAHNRGDQAHWSFSAPANTRIASFIGHRAGRAGVGQPYGSPGVMVHADGRALEICTQFYGCSAVGTMNAWNGNGNSFAFHELDAATVGFVTDCGGGDGGVCPAEDPSAVGLLFRTQLMLSDSLDPQTSGVSGSLAQPGAHRGTEWLTVNVTDQGSGVYRGIVEMDGKAVVDQVLDSNGGKCADAEPSDSDPYEFFDKQPCKLSISASVGLDTTRFSEGAHTIRVRVVDAAGNSTTAFGPSAFEVRNQPQPNTGSAVTAGGASGSGSPSGSPAVAAGVQSEAPGARGALNGTHGSDRARIIAAFDRNGSRTLTARYGKAVVIRGRLVNEAGRGIGGASLDVARRRSKSILSTLPDGSFTLILPRTASSQSILLGYRSHAGDAGFATSTALTLKVKAAVRLRITPRRVRNRQAVTFRGRLLGGPIPRAGKLVELQVRFPSGWRTFATVRASRNGAFRFRYRFLRSYQPITYKFRARSRRDGSYPYETGSSRTVRVRVG